MMLWKYSFWLVLAVVVASQDLASKPAHFQELGLCDDAQYLGNEKDFTLRIPFGESIETFTFPKVEFFACFFFQIQKDKDYFAVNFAGIYKIGYCDTRNSSL